MWRQADKLSVCAVYRHSGYDLADLDTGDVAAKLIHYFKRGCSVGGWARLYGREQRVLGGGTTTCSTFSWHREPDLPPKVG
jgi:hypothetical protein